MLNAGLPTERKQPNCFLHNFIKILTDFDNFFIITLISKFAIKRSITKSHHTAKALLHYLVNANVQKMTLFHKIIYQYFIANLLPSLPGESIFTARQHS